MTRRIHGLDALRGVAAVAVLLFHYTTRYDVKYGHVSPPLVSVPLGFRGVDLFFILSGFVIFMTLDRTRRALDFVVSRFSRLFPAFWVSVAATYLVVTLFGLPDKQVSATDLLLNFTMVPELLHARLVDGAYWTLEVELLFYAAMLALYVSGLLRHVHWVLAAWLALRVAVHELERHGVAVSYLFAHLLVLPHIALFGAGMMLHRLVSEPAMRGRSAALWLACMAVVAWTGPLDALAVALAGSAAVWGVLRGRLQMLAHPVLVFLGTISYPLYLLHENIGFTIIRAASLHGMPTDLSIVLAMVVMVAVAAVCAYGVERPVMRWIRRRWGERVVRVPTGRDGLRGSVGG